MIHYTTLNEIRGYSPCESSWITLLSSLDKTKSDDEPLSFKYILDTLGIKDAIWCLRVLSDYDLDVMRFKLRCARRVEHLDKSGSAKKCLDVVERFIKGDASENDLKVADAYAYSAYAVANDAAANAAAYTAANAANASAVEAADAASRAAYAAAYTAAYTAAASAASASDEHEYQRKIFIELFCGE